MNHNLVKKLSLRFCTLFFIFISCVFFSCTRVNSRLSFTSMLDSVDALIEAGYYTDASKELARIEKYAYDSWSKIGIYRRYYNLGETDRAEKLLKKALKKNPNNFEMSALYSHLLLQSGRKTEALEVAKCLQGTRFGSFYTEAYFSVNGEEQFYIDERYLNLYYDAYIGTNDSYWLRNCALIHLKDGKYASATKFFPTECYLPEDAYFWALVAFDAEHFASAVAFAEKSNSLYETSPISSRHFLSKIEIASILSDSYLALSDSEEAENARSSIIAQLEQSSAGFNILDKNVQNLLPSIFVDSALYANSSNNRNYATRLLTNTLDSWPDYVPALIAYADLARLSLNTSQPDMAENMLRDSGLASLKMEQYDDTIRVPISDALYRMERSLEKNRDSRLYVSYLNLKYENDSSITQNEKLADVWNELEKNQVSPNVYDVLVLEYALNTLILHGRCEDAWTVFSRHIARKYSFDSSHNFWDEVLSNVKSFSIREAEYAAWFSAFYKYGDTAIALYEYCVFENNGVDEKKIISHSVSSSSCVNLSMIYHSLGMTDKAIELYSQTANRSISNIQKAECMYRLAEIYKAQNRVLDASKAASYALLLNPGHARAKLLRDTL
ncbi:MAG: tetratricopeptide repeat protein [Treponema sp.]|nr:tetratricopeptide repeat protein [Treponema sp.]